MKYFIRLFLVVIIAGLAGILQVAVISVQPYFIPLDITIVGSLLLVTGRRLPESIIAAIVAGGTMDALQGWQYPLHSFALVVMVLLFYVLSKQIFSAQTSTSVISNAILVTTLTLTGRQLLAGIGFFTIIGERISFNGAVVMIVSQAILTGIILGVTQTIRRRHYTNIIEFGT